MPGFFGALTTTRDSVEFGGDFAELKILPEQRVDVLDLGALRIASVERPGERGRIALCPRTGATLLVKGVIDIPARTLLAKALADGRESLVGLPGHYAVLLWEPERRRFTVATDELGLYPVYVCDGPCALLFGTQSWPFSRAQGFRREADPAALVELLRVEYLLGDRAMARGVRLLPPGSILEASPGARPRVRRVRDPFRDRAPAPGSHAEAEERLARAYDRAFARTVPAEGRLEIPLSGGKDSRTVLCEILRREPLAEDRIETLTLGSLDQWDARCARRLARVARVRWRGAPVDRTLHDRWLDRYTLLMDGSSSVFATWWAGVLEAIDGAPGTVVSGFLGDALSGHHLSFFHPAYETPGGGAVPAEPGLDPYLARLARRCWSREALARVLRPDVAAAFLDGPERALSEIYFGDGAAPRHVRMMRTDLETRQRRFIASQLHLYRQRHPVSAPFADPAIVGAFLSFPEAYLRDQSVYRATFAQRHPRAARVMEATSRAPYHGRLVDRLRCRAEVLAIDARDRLAAKLLRAPPPRRNFFSFQHIYRDSIADELEPLDRFFDPDALRAALAREGPDSNRVRLLYTARAWLRRAAPDFDIIRRS